MLELQTPIACSCEPSASPCRVPQPLPQPSPGPALPQQRCQGRRSSSTFPSTCQALKMAFSALVAQPPARGAAPPQGTAVTSFAPDLSFLVLSAPGKYSRLKATGFFFTYHSRNSYRVIFVRVTVVYAYLLFTDCRILPITSLVGLTTRIHAFR